MDHLIRAVTSLSRVAGVIGALLIGAAVLVICDIVVERYLLNLTTIWQIDVVTYCIVGATFIASPYVLMTRGHVNVDVLPTYLGPRGRFRLAVFAAVVGIAFCATLTVLGAMLWYDAWDRNWVSDTMWRAPLWMPYASMPVGLSILTLQYIVDFGNLLTGREPPFGMKPKGAP